MSGRLIAVLTFAAAAALGCDHEPLNLAAPTASSAPAPQASSARSASATVVQAQHATELPYKGSYTFETSAVFTPPNTLTISGTATGNATHLGRFTATFVDVVDVTTTASTGTFTFTAANGDQFFATTAGGEDEFIPPNVSRVTLDATVVGGTGRFAAATGTFIIRSIGVIDFAAGTSSGSGSFQGRIDINK